MMGNFYSSQHPNAVFRNNLVASLILPNRILSLMNSTYHQIEKDNTEVFEITGHTLLQKIIKRDFYYDLNEQDSERFYNLYCLGQ